MEINDGYIPKQKPSIQQIIEQEAKTLMLGNSTLKQAFISGANFALGLDRWVKVEEGCEFPEVNSWVLVCNGGAVGIVFYQAGIELLGYTHWQPFPVPPQK